MSLDRIEIEGRTLPRTPVAVLVAAAAVSVFVGLAWRQVWVERIGDAPPAPVRIACDAFDTPTVCIEAAPVLADAPRSSEALAALRRTPPAELDGGDVAGWGALSDEDAALIRTVLTLTGREVPAPSEGAYAAASPEVLAARYASLRDDAWRGVATRLHEADRLRAFEHEMLAKAVAFKGFTRLAMMAALAVCLLAAAAIVALRGRRTTLVLTPHHLAVEGRRVPWAELDSLTATGASLSWRLHGGERLRAWVRLDPDEAERIHRAARTLATAAQTEGDERRDALQALEALRER